MIKNKRTNFYVSIILIIFSIFLCVGCTKGNDNLYDVSLNENSEQKISQEKIFDDNVDIKSDETSKVVNDNYIEVDSNENDLENWIGNYEYTEFVEPNINLVMNLSIYKDESYKARLEINGFQTWIDLIAKVEVNEDKIQIIYNENNINDDSSTLFNDGDILFELMMHNDEILTYWGKVMPFDVNNQENGKVYIEKVD